MLPRNLVWQYYDYMSIPKDALFLAVVLEGLASGLRMEFLSFNDDYPGAI